MCAGIPGGSQADADGPPGGRVPGRCLAWQGEPTPAPRPARRPPRLAAGRAHGADRTRRHGPDGGAGAVGGRRRGPAGRRVPARGGRDRGHRGRRQRGTLRRRGRVRPDPGRAHRAPAVGHAGRRPGPRCRLLAPAAAPGGRLGRGAGRLGGAARGAVAAGADRPGLRRPADLRRGRGQRHPQRSGRPVRRGPADRVHHRGAADRAVRAAVAGGSAAAGPAGRARSPAAGAAAAPSGGGAPGGARDGGTAAGLCRRRPGHHPDHGCRPRARRHGLGADPAGSAQSGLARPHARPGGDLGRPGGRPVRAADAARAGRDPAHPGRHRARSRLAHRPRRADVVAGGRGRRAAARRGLPDGRPVTVPDPALAARPCTSPSRSPCPC